jgi:nifR3 family TIM-barrel protein
VHETLKIGNISLEHPLVLSPLSGISDLPYRLINRKFGCPLAFVEMTSARALFHANRKMEKMLASTPEDRPLGIQLLGKEPDYLKRALEILEKHKFDVIDFNAACPVKKIVANGEGASLLKEPKKLKELLKVLVERSGVPVTVKIRAGWDDSSINAKEAALNAEDAGISALFIHGRTRAQKYSGAVNYSVIKEVKEAINIPVIGSGDVLSPQAAIRMLNESGCDGVVMARGAMGNPWIFREVAELLRSGEIPPRPGTDEIINVMEEHLRLHINLHGLTHGIKTFRKHFVWYTRGLRGIKPLRVRAMRARSLDEMKEVINLIISDEQITSERLHD